MRNAHRLPSLALTALAAVLTVGTAASALAAAAPSASGGAAALSVPSLPPVMTQGDVRYVSGGIGQDEEQAMRAAEKRFPLTLEFIAHAQPHPEYLADIPVTIRDHAGRTVLQAVSAGPYLLAQLKPGRYTVSARENGVTRTDHLALASGKPQKVVFEWSR